MKIRSGFVSNSSTSSYIVMTTKEVHERLLQTLKNKDALSACTLFQEKHLFGKDLVILNYISGNDAMEISDMFDMEKLEQSIPDSEEIYDAAWECIDAYINAVEKIEGDGFVHSEDL